MRAIFPRDRPVDPARGGGGISLIVSMLFIVNISLQEILKTRPMNKRLLLLLLFAGICTAASAQKVAVKTNLLIRCHDDP